MSNLFPIVIIAVILIGLGWAAGVGKTPEGNPVTYWIALFSIALAGLVVLLVAGFESSGAHVDWLTIDVYGGLCVVAGLVGLGYALSCRRNG